MDINDFGRLKVSDFKRILLAEPDPAILGFLKETLENAGYAVTAVADGMAAKQVIEAGRPDLVVAAVTMPGMDGVELVKFLKIRPETREIPVVVLAANEFKDETFRGYGVTEIIDKPVEDYVLLYKVACLLNQSKSFSRINSQARIVIAGTSNDVLQKMMAALNMHGCKTDAVFRADDVAVHCRALEPALLILDVQMEDQRSSAWIVREIRKWPKEKQFPIILYSFFRSEDLGSESLQQKAISIDKSSQSCLQSGAALYIGKFSPETFWEKIKPHVPKTGGAR